MRRPDLSFLISILACMPGAVAAGKPKPKGKPNPKPVRVQKLGKTGLKYWLRVPRSADPKRPAPLVVVAQFKHGRAHQSFNVWQGLAKHDQLFLASLNVPRRTKHNQAQRIIEMVKHLCGKYKAIARDSLVLIGLQDGAQQAVQTVAAYPRVFAAAAALDVRRLADVRKIKPHPKPAFSPGGTRLWVTYDPRYVKSGRRLGIARHRLRKLGVSVDLLEAATLGMGKPSEAEGRLAVKIVRGQYPPQHRKRIAEKIQKEAEQEKAEQAAARKKKSPKTKKGTHKEEKKPDPDEILLAAQKAYDASEYARALTLYRRLAKLRPKSDYARVANQRIEELENDPAVRRMARDAAAEDEARPLLNLARNYNRAGDLPKAVTYYRKIIARFPKTTFAETAERELHKLLDME